MFDIRDITFENMMCFVIQITHFKSLIHAEGLEGLEVGQYTFANSHFSLLSKSTSDLHAKHTPLPSLKKIN